MTETSNTGDKTISVKQTLGLKRGSVERGTVRQSFSHGRTNTVQVERKKRRLVLPADQKPESPAPAPPKTVKSEVPEPVSEATGGQASRSGLVLRQLSGEEIDARARALSHARVHEAEERQQAREVAVREAEEAEQAAREHQQAERRQAEETTRREAEEATRARAEEAARRRFGEEEKKPAAGAAPKALKAGESEEQRRPLRGRLKTSRPADDHNRGVS